MDATPEQVGELAGQHGIVLHGLVGTADLEQAFFRLHPGVRPRRSVQRPKGVVVKALLHAELLKLRSTRTTAGLLLATLGLVALTVASGVPKVGAAEGPLSLDDPGLLADVVATCFGVPQVLMVLYGTLAFTQEFRYGTITSTYLGEPRRTRVLVAKWLALALVSAVITTATLALSVPFSSALIRSRDGDVTFAGHFWRVVAIGFVVMAAYGVIGVAIGALVRNQVAAVVGVIVWMTRRRVHRHPLVPRCRTLDALWSDAVRCSSSAPSDSTRICSLSRGWARPSRVYGCGSRPCTPHHTQEGVL